MKRTKLLILATVITGLLPGLQGQEPPYAGYIHHPWVDSVLATLNPRERVAQSIWVTTGANGELPHYLLIDQLVREHGIGGLLIRGEDLYTPGVGDWMAGVVRYFRSVSRLPLALAVEGGTGVWPGGPDNGNGSWQEGGAELHSWPGAQALAAVEDDTLLRRMGERLALQYRQTGTQLLLVTRTGTGIPGGTGFPEAIASQLLEARILPVARPAAGPEDTELYWKLPAAGGVEGVTVIRTGAEPDMARAKLFSMLDAEETDTISVNRAARMVLAFKYWAGLDRETPRGGARANAFAGDPGNGALVRDLYARALTVLKNDGELIPVKGLDHARIATVAVAPAGASGRDPVPFHPRGALTPFQEMAGRYTRMDHFYWSPETEGEDQLLGALARYDLVLAGIYPEEHADREIPENLEGMEAFMASLSERTRLVSVFFGGPEQLRGMESPGLPESLILTYDRNRFTEELAAQLIFGGIGGKGKLPAALGDRYPAGSGLTTGGGGRLQYALPENAGVSSRLLHHKIDSVVNAGLGAEAFPGCEVIAARRGMVIFHKTYGYQTYDRRMPVQQEDLYDLASVTKVSGPLAGLMVLEGMGKFSHNDLLGEYVPAMRGSDKADLWLKEILAHQAGLYPWIPYWQQTVKKNGDFKRRLVRSSPSEKYSMVIAGHLYLNNRFKKTIYRTIKKSPLGKKEYIYSGLAFFLFPGVIEELSGESYEDFLYDHLYHRLGAWDLVYKPFRDYPLSRIVPTEYDSIFRKQQIHGYVHDESSATMDGLSGNAGLFATANDLLKLVEMYRRMGSYGGEQIIPETVLEEYTRYQFPENLNRRGLGFDKPLLGERDGTPGDYPCPGASPSSFGHSGFTGTFIWADPEHEISYVFLSNRVYPTRNNNLISDMNIRTEVLQAIYDSILVP